MKTELCGARDIAYLGNGAVSFWCRLVMCDASELVGLIHL